MDVVCERLKGEGEMRGEVKLTRFENQKTNKKK